MSFSAQGREFRSANAIWLQEGMPLNQGYEQDMNAYGLQCIIGTQIYGSGEADIPTMTSDWVIADI